MKLTRTHIALLAAVAVAVVTLNALWRVRYFGQKEREYWEGRDASPGAPREVRGPVPDAASD